MALPFKFWMFCVIIIVITSIVGLVQSSPSYCQSTTSQKNDFPSLPDRFYIGIEQTFNGKSVDSDSEDDNELIMVVQESYDKPRNQLAIATRVMGQRSLNIVDFSSNQLFSMANADGEERSCKTYSCDSDDCKKILDNLNPQLSQFNFKNGRIFPASHLFGIDEDHLPVYMGLDTWDGIDVERWDTCEPGGQTNRSVYWTVANDWQTPIAGPMPVAISVVTVSGFELTNYISTVAWYKPNYTESQAFQMPEGIICDGWKSEMVFPPTPTLARAFQFRSEVLISGDHSAGKTHEWFDVSEGIYRVDQEEKGDVAGVTAMTEIIDKTQGQVYRIGLGGCNVDRLDRITFDILSSAAAATTLLQASSDNSVADFFGYGTKYLYVGEQRIRNINTFIWEGLRTGPNGVGSTISALWRWHFTSVSDKNGEVRLVPVRRNLNILENGDTDEGSIKPDTRIMHLIYDFQYLSADSVDPAIFDLTSCFQSEDWLHLKMQISAAKQSNGQDPGPDFFRLWRKSLANYTGLQLLGISETEVRVVKGTTWLQFKLLPLGTIKTKSYSNNNEPTTDSTKSILSVARQKLQNAIDSNQVSITYQSMSVQASGTLQDVALSCHETSTVAPTTDNSPTTSPTENRPEDQFFDAGVAAAVGVAFTVLGFSVASGGTYLYSRRCPTTFR